MGLHCRRLWGLLERRPGLGGPAAGASSSPPSFLWNALTQLNLAGEGAGVEGPGHWQGWL